MGGMAPETWRRRRWLAVLVRVFYLSLPLAASLGASALLYRTSWIGGVTPILRWLIYAAVASVVLAAVHRSLARLLPLAALLEVSVAFPGEAPSRYAVARDAGNTAKLREIVERAQRGDPVVASDDAQAARDILALVAALRTHDSRTRGHSERVRVYADLIAEQMALDPASREKLRWAALLHDVGKLEVPSAVLNKPGKLDAGEWAMVSLHPAAGARLTSPLNAWLGEWARTIPEHHEKYDGTGYPAGLAGADISIGGRILAVADSFEVMTAPRSYKPPMSRENGLRELRACAGSQFDPQVVRAMLAVSTPRLRVAMGPLAWLGSTPFALATPAASTIVLQAGAALSVGAVAVVAPAGTLSPSTATTSTVHVAPGSGSLQTTGRTAPSPVARQTTPSSAKPSPTSPVSSPTPTTSSPVATSSPVPTKPAPAQLTIKPITVYVVEGRPIDIDVAARDPRLVAATVALTRSPAHGVAGVTSHGSIGYKPQGGFRGTDRLAFSACARNGQCGTAAVTVHVLDKGQQHADLRGLDMTGSNLSGIDVSHADLAGTNLTDANLTDAALSGADLTGAVLTGATLTGAHLSDAVLVGAHLAGVNLSHLDLSGADLSGADLRGANLAGAKLDNVKVTSTTQLAGANLTGVTGGPAPKLSSTTVSTTKGQAVVIDVLARITDSLVPVAPGSLTLLVAPAHGTVVLAADHTITYTPKAGYVGNDAFKIRFSNVLTFTGTGSISIHVTA